MPGLGTSLGRGGATTNQMDVRFADAVLIMGSNMAECHPVSFRFVMEAKLNGATILHVDPRFTRTSAMADVYAPLRAGSDIVFLGGLIHHVLEHDAYFHEYVLHYTNAASLIKEGPTGPSGCGLSITLRVGMSFVADVIRGCLRQRFHNC